MSISQDIVKEVEQWLGVPYQHRGITNRGCDCSGLLIGVLQSLGYMKDYQLRKYPKDWNLHAMADNYLEEELLKIANEIKEAPQPGDVLLFFFGRCKAHLGIVTKHPLFVHCYKDSKKVVYGVMNKVSPWYSNLAGVYRIDENKLRNVK